MAKFTYISLELEMIKDRNAKFFKIFENVNDRMNS